MVDENKIPVPETAEEACIQSVSHDGHRYRMLQRYREKGLPGFEEHEVLEMLLFRSIPRSNTNPLAHKMLDVCGSMEAVLERAADDALTVPGVGQKTMDMLRETRDAMEAYCRQMLLQTDPLERMQFYTAAVWFLRRYPERILLVLCDSMGKPEEIGTIENAEPAEILDTLRCFLRPGMLCHIACIGRDEELARLRKCSTGARMGMFLSLSVQWVPAWK